MTDKNLTNNETIKALEGAILNAKGCDSKVWSIEIYKLENALDLINRQKAEIERLEEESADKERAYTAEYYLRKELKTELKTAKSEAIKEFIDELKNRVVNKYEYTDIRVFKEIDNLVKEMTE